MAEARSTPLGGLVRWTVDSAGSERGMFVLVTVAVNLAFLIRSYVAMRVLNYAELGAVALMQSIVLVIGALQCGILNGGYRLLCSEESVAGRQINNVVCSLLAVIAVVCLAAGALVLAALAQPGYAQVTYLGIIAGVLTLLKNWLSNCMVARISLRLLNQLNMLSAFVSLAVLLCVAIDPLLVCMGSILLQPLLFVVSAMACDRWLAPSGFDLSGLLLRRMFASGFVVFLSSVFLLANGQMERWFILSFNGADGLGHYFLTLLYVNLYALVPGALDAIFLPLLVKDHARGDVASLRRNLSRFLLITAVYSLGIVLGTLLLAQPALAVSLPRYLPDLKYLYLVMPGLFVFGLTGPMAIVFNVLIQYRFYFLAYGLGSVLTATLLGAAGYLGAVADLRTVSVIKSATYLLMSALIVWGYLAIARRRPEFRFGNPGGVRHAST